MWSLRFLGEFKNCKGGDNMEEKSKRVSEVLDAMEAIELLREQQKEKRREKARQTREETKFKIISEEPELGFEKKIRETFPDHTGKLYSGLIRLPYSDQQRIFAIELTFVPKLLPFIVESKGVAFQIRKTEMSLSFFGSGGRAWAVQDLKKRHFIAFESLDEGNITAVLCGLAILTDQVQKIYDFLVELLMYWLPFESGEPQVAGYDETIQWCEQILRCDDPRIMNRHILLAGPPGCGKTMIAKKLAQMLPEFVRINLRHTGQWLRVIESLEELMLLCQRKVIVFIDEIDELGLSRNVSRTEVYALLKFLDGIEEQRAVKIIATTNRPSDLDEALLRVGRLGPIISVDFPTREQKIAILQYYAKKYEAQINADRIVNLIADGITGAIIRAAFENCIIREVDITTDNVITELQGLHKVVKAYYQA